jgi:predicted RecA/RadA family phage recombinase
MKNFIEMGASVTAIATAPVTSGVPVLIEGVFLVPKSDAKTGEVFAALYQGGFILAKKATIAVKQFEAAYWVAADNAVTNVKATNVLIGFFLDAADAAGATANVQLTGVVKSV